MKRKKKRKTHTNFHNTINNKMRLQRPIYYSPFETGRDLV